MNLETQVVSIALAKEMAELGFEQDSLFSWIVYEDKTAHIELTKWAKTQYVGIGIKESVLYAAYTVAELGAMLPESIITGVAPTTYYLSITKRVYPDCDEWHVKYRNESTHNTHCVFKECTQADAYAQACIWLRTVGHI
jgi:hypothetical protein